MRYIRPLFLGLSYISILGNRVPQVLSTKCSARKMSETASSSTTADGGSGYVAGTSSVAFVMTPDEASAKKIAHSLVSNNLAACVNLIPQITSIYQWDGKINEDTEYLLILKTRTSRVDELTKFVRENHPYSVAEVISFPIENGNIPYLDWITKTVPEKA